jgi:hypothetical protein
MEGIMESRKKAEGTVQKMEHYFTLEKLRTVVLHVPQAELHERDDTPRARRHVEKGTSWMGEVTKRSRVNATRTNEGQSGFRAEGGTTLRLRLRLAY